MSRHSLYDEKEMTPEKVKALYYEEGSLPAAARKVGVSRKTFWNWTRMAGMELERGNPLHHDYGCLPMWVRDNPGVPLPISPTRIADLTGCTVHAVKAYLKRRRGELAMEVKALPDLRKVKGKSLLTTEGYALPLIAIASYVITTPRLRVRISGALKSGRPFTIATSMDKLKEALK